MKKLLKTIFLMFISISLVSCTKTEKLFPENREKLVFDASQTKQINKVNMDILTALLKNKKTDDNLILSPLSIQRCLDLISLCTDDRENLQLFKFYDEAHLQNLKFKNTKLANLILINLQNIKGETKNLNYDNIKTVKSATEGTKAYQKFQKSNLDEILDKEKISDDVVASFIDTINYEVKWKQPFDEKKTEKRDFTKSDGSKIQVDTMYNHFENVTAISNDVMEIFSIRSNDSNIYFIKPKEEQNFSAEQLQNLINTFKESNERYDVNFYLPKIDIKSQVDFMNLFPKIGLGKLLNEFKIERLLPDMNVKVSKAKQNAILKIDEKGAKAKAVTKIDVKETSMPVKNKNIDIKMDRPFYIFIEDYDENSKTELITFSAYISDPSKK
ncbi:serpin family protein [Parvimonas sp. D2]|uniref:serpin family protein n=1 Tax=unclassified Parvimonas TaxID=1151464 RepID=UPI002B493B50|nr:MULTISPECIES: serpin family protein [unclassified Parvimonas]MEB3012271.1 serpin family protein [Parvimonas sp. D2]MEB3087784.1 serpin family protein [Parvimonas sp. D4]